MVFAKMLYGTGKIEHINYEVDIQQWCNDIAYTQWNMQECRSGEAWAHLRPLVFN